MLARARIGPISTVSIDVLSISYKIYKFLICKQVQLFIDDFVN